MNSTSPSVNLKIICSTPNTKKVHSFEVTPLISPIKTQIQEQSYNLPTDSYYDGDCVLNNQNIAKNNIFPYNKHILTLPRKLELSGFEILNSSQQTDNSEQNGDIQKLNYSDSRQSEIYFISRDPKKFQYKNYISKSNISNLSNVSSEKSYNRKKKKINSRNISSAYFEDNSKKVEFPESDFKKPSIVFTNKSSTVLKQSLSEKIKKNSSLFNKNRLVSESITSPPINIKTSNPKQTKYNNQQSTSESWSRISETFNEISFSDFDKTSQTETMTKHNQSKSMHHNEIEQDSSLKYYDTREKNANSWCVESQNNNREEDSISSINSSPKVANEFNNYEDHKIYEPSMSHLSLPTFTDTISLNSTLNSDKLVSIQHQSISWSEDSSNAIHYEENYIKQNNGTVVINNTLSEEIQFTSKENISMSFSSENNSSIFSTADSLAYISNFNENLE
ncbi:GATA zinc finger domain-containing protein 14-like isoform X2 [Metopolophium dirhodum]|uniref:GATA zinc finger domain-containing protein 14-like isoform X2 n=1 Tax=Metopolophium dirhodum TaxID=44670 RepID=UPI0029900421|nr:GATA zinc finger domain-containing protein 14-like isoform X2 [Metopolophium dirhodum]